jgi:hypothetical protein
MRTIWREVPGDVLGGCGGLRKDTAIGDGGGAFLKLNFFGNGCDGMGSGGFTYSLFF